MRFCFILAGVVALALGMTRSGVAAGPGLKATTVVKVDSRSGRLVRRVVVGSLDGKTGSSRPGANALRKSARVDELVEEAARKHNVDPLLIHSVIQVESGYDPFAVSPKGAVGLMQLVPATALRYGVRNSFDPKQNIDAGVRYLKYLQDLFNDEDLTLAAYNAGEGAVISHQWIVPPYQETQEYVRRVGLKYQELKRKAEKGIGSKMPEEAGEEYRPLVSFVDSEGRLHLRTR